VIMLTGWRDMLTHQVKGGLRADAILGKPPHLQELYSTLAKMAGPQNS
jgi:hypothetical protein